MPLEGKGCKCSTGHRLPRRPLPTKTLTEARKKPLPVQRRQIMLRSVYWSGCGFQAVCGQVDQVCWWAVCRGQARQSVCHLQSQVHALLDLSEEEPGVLESYVQSASCAYLSYDGRLNIWQGRSFIGLLLSSNLRSLGLCLRRKGH